MDRLTQEACTDADRGSFAIRLDGISKSFANAGESLEVLRISISPLPSRRSWVYSGPPVQAKARCSTLSRASSSPTADWFVFAARPSDESNDWCAISYMFQDDRLLPWRTAIRNVEFALEAGSLPKAERARRSRETLRLVQLEGFEEAFPYQLSGGMRSRVALARSLVTDPRILLMDEPFSRLDAQTRTLMHDELLRIHQLKRMTVVFVTHDVAEAVLLADEVAVMSPRPGTIREVVDISLGRPRDITQPEVTSYIQRLRALI